MTKQRTPDEPYDTNHKLAYENAYKPNSHRLAGLLYALKLTIFVHPQNDNLRKRLTTIMFVTWALVSVLTWTGYAAPDKNIYWALTVVVFSIMSHLWGFEYGVLTTLVQGPRDADDEPAPPAGPPTEVTRREPEHDPDEQE